MLNGGVLLLRSEASVIEGTLANRPFLRQGDN